jgi:hypothetical protein
MAQKGLYRGGNGAPAAAMVYLNPDNPAQPVEFTLEHELPEGERRFT